MARILIIEDNPTNLELMSYLLTAFGHTTMVAYDGDVGLATAQRERPDMIICDVQMPKIDGNEGARQLKRSPALHDIPLVAVTALAMVGDSDRIMAAGFDGYVAKPIAPALFVSQVEAFLPADQRSAGRVPVAPTANAPRPKTERATILVVDNSRVNIDLARGTLEPFGYRVVAAHTVQEGLALARRAAPDLILSDLHMPGEDGYAFIRAIKADAQLLAIPFVFISSTIWKDQDRLVGLDLGAARFIVRPIEPRRLLAEVEACLRDAGKGKDLAGHGE
jgi:two-component system cell cycle response regulator